MPTNIIYAPTIMSNAVTKIQAFTRARQAKQRMAKLRADRVRDRLRFSSRYPVLPCLYT